MKRILTASIALFVATASPQAATLTLFAGTGLAGFDGDSGPALKAKLNNPYGIVRGPDGAMWFADYEAHVIRRIAADGTIDTVVGTGTPGYSGDGGPARLASLKNPHELRFDRNGILYIADTGNHAIRRYDPRSKQIMTFAGTGLPGYTGDGGPAVKATFREPISLQFGPTGDLFIADIGNNVLRRIDSKTGTISTWAGTGKSGPTPDGAPITGTPLRGPRSLDFDRSGKLWLVTREGNQVLRFDLAAGTINLVAGTEKSGFAGDGGRALEATFSGPKGIAVAPNGDVYLADTENHVIRRINNRNSQLERVAGTGEKGNSMGEDPLKTPLNRPHGVFVDADGTLFISDSENSRILTLKP